MGDYGRRLQFGIFPSPETANLDTVLAMARVADEQGLDLIGIQDHPYQSRFLDTWSLMATILARTERVRVFPDVTCLPLRPPAVMAKAAASLDVISAGRFELGLGAGGFWDAIGAMGGPVRGPGAAAGALTEAVDVIRLMWSGQRSVRFDGQHYRLAGVHPGPSPAHRIGIWLGVGGPRMLSVLGRSADGWVPSHSFVPPPKLPAMHARIDAAASECGREPAEIQRIYNVFGSISGGAAGGPLQGPVRQWVEELTSFSVQYGMDTFVFGPAEDEVRQIERFVAEVVPGVREAVARHRED